MDTKNWWQSKTIWSAIVTLIATLASIAGHNIDSGAQTNLVNGLTVAAEGVALIAGTLTPYFRKTATTIIAAAPVAAIPAITEYQITVNGAAMTWNKPEITYEDILAIVKLSGTPTMTYYSRSGGGGIMHPGQSITISDNLVFNAVHTGNA